VLAVDLSNFRQGGAWDAQRVGRKFHKEFVDDATVNIGLYGAAAGITQGQLLSVQDSYAALQSHFSPGTKMDAVYVHLPERNVQNTKLGYELFNSGRIGR